MKRNKNAQCAAVLLGMLAIQLVMHLNCDSLLLDDHVFFAALEGTEGLWPFLAQRWQTWSSRILIEAVLAFTTHSIWLWRAADSMMMVLLAYSLCAVAGCEKRPGMQLLSALMVTALPFGILRSTGWQATSLNYYWPLAAGATALIPAARALRDEPTSGTGMIFYAAAAVFAANSEQMAALLTGSYALLGVLCYGRRKRIPGRICLLFGLCLAELLLILSCPGNAVRSRQSIALVNLRDYGQFDLVDKLSIGMTSTSALLLFTKNPMLMIYGITALCAAWGRRRSAGELLLTAVPLLFAVTMVYGRTLLPETAAQTAQRYSEYTLMMGPQYIAQAGQAAMHAAVLCVLALLPAMAYPVIGHRGTAAMAAIAVCAGGAARMIVAFSPTIVESGERTMLPLYGAMMLCALLFIKDVYRETGRRAPEWIAAAAAALLAAANVAASFSLAM